MAWAVLGSGPQAQAGTPADPRRDPLQGGEVSQVTLQRRPRSSWKQKLGVIFSWLGLICLGSAWLALAGLASGRFGLTAQAMLEQLDLLGLDTFHSK